MLSLRGITTGAVVLLVSGVATGAAVAQTATADAPGKPLQLLRIVEQPAAKPKAAPHNKIHAALHRAVAMRNLRRHTVVAEAKAEQSEPTVRDAPPPAVSMDDADAAPATTLAAADQTLQAPAPAAPAMGALVVGRPMVDVASPAEVNALDLAADKTGNGPTDPSPSVSAPQAGISDKVAALAAPAAAAISEIASKSDSIAAAAAAPKAASSAVGSPGWIAQVMAALAGAVAAGALAWFLIGAAPQRRYG